MIPSQVLRTLACAALSSLVLLAPEASARSSFTQGNLIVVRVGDGLTAPSSAAHPVFLDEYTTAGALVQSIALPTGAGDAFTNSGSATSEGFLSFSADGNYLIQAGYRAAPGTASVVSTTSAANPRVIARTDLDGNVDTTTALGDAYSGNNIRSATSDDGTQFWTGGTAASGGSVRYAAGLGATTSTQLSTTITNIRVVTVQNGQLYCTSATGAFQGLSEVGTGLPTTSGQTITLLSGFPTTSGPSPYDHFFADANTVYVADDRTNGSGGIQKWTLNAGTWSLQYTLAPAANVGCRGLSGIVTGGVATLYATTSNAFPNQLVAVADTGAGASFTTVTSAGTNTSFRGIRYYPVKSSSETIVGSGCPGPSPVAAISGGAPIIGNASFEMSVNSATPGTSSIMLVQFNVPSGSPRPNFPYFGCNLAFDFLAPFFAFGATTDGSGNAGILAPLPNDPLLLDVELRFQWFVQEGVQVAGYSVSNAVLFRIGEA